MSADSQSTFERETRTVSLSRPIQAHGNTVHELTLKEPTLGDLEGVEPFHIRAGDGGTTLIPRVGEFPAVISRLANIPLSSAKSISVADLMSIGGVIADFFGIAPQIGTKPLQKSPMDTASDEAKS